MYAGCVIYELCGATNRLQSSVGPCKLELSTGRRGRRRESRDELMTKERSHLFHVARHCNGLFDFAGLGRGRVRVEAHCCYLTLCQPEGIRACHGWRVRSTCRHSHEAGAWSISPLHVPPTRRRSPGRCQAHPAGAAQKGRGLLRWRLAHSPVATHQNAEFTP